RTVERRTRRARTGSARSPTGSPRTGDRLPVAGPRTAATRRDDQPFLPGRQACLQFHPWFPPTPWREIPVPEQTRWKVAGLHEIGRRFRRGECPPSHRSNRVRALYGPPGVASLACAAMYAAPVLPAAREYAALYRSFRWQI